MQARYCPSTKPLHLPPRTALKTSPNIGLETEFGCVCLVYHKQRCLYLEGIVFQTSSTAAFLQAPSTAHREHLAARREHSRDWIGSGQGGDRSVGPLILKIWNPSGPTRRKGSGAVPPAAGPAPRVLPVQLEGDSVTGAGDCCRVQAAVTSAQAAESGLSLGQPERSHLPAGCCALPPAGAGPQSASAPASGRTRPNLRATLAGRRRNRVVLFPLMWALIFFRAGRLPRLAGSAHESDSDSAALRRVSAPVPAWESGRRRARTLRLIGHGRGTRSGSRPFPRRRGMAPPVTLPTSSDLHQRHPRDPRSSRAVVTRPGRAGPATPPCRRRRPVEGGCGPGPLRPRAPWAIAARLGRRRPEASCAVVARGRARGAGRGRGRGSCSCLPRSAAAVRDLARRRRWRGRRTTATGKKLQRRELCGLHFGHWAVASWHEHAHVVAVEQDLRGPFRDECARVRDPAGARGKRWWERRKKIKPAQVW